jgi:TonB-linked SusC/RagA family outer membrane protein
MNHKKDQRRKGLHFHFRESISVLLVALTCFLFSPASIFAQGNASDGSGQQITVKGKVFDETNSPVIGASVLVVGTKTGTVTDINGTFTIKAPVNGSLMISYIGYVAQKFKVSDNLSHIVLKEDAAKLEEVVVVGYGQVKRANLTGAVSNISMKEVADIPSPNLASVLMGTMPGVNVSEATGNPVGNATIKIRINGSWNTEDPLYVIDGFIRDVDAFNLLDASEIENISVLKDAQAAIYGVRGAGGVILVTTKKGKTGKAKVSYSGSFGVNQGVEIPELMSAYEQGMALNDLWQQNITYKGTDPATVKFFTSDELTKMKTMDYNWLEMGWKNSGNNRHTLNVSGGNEDVRYFVGGSYMFANGNFSNLNMNRYGLRMGVDAKLAKNLSANFSMSYSAKNTEMPLNQKDAEPERMYGTFSDLARAPRFIPAYINGLPVGNSIPANGTHPLEVMNSGSYRRTKTNDVAAGLSLEYTIEQIKGLKVAISGNYNNTSGYGKQLSKPYYVYNFIPQGDTQNSYLISEVQYPVSDDRYRQKIINSDKLYESASYSYSYQLNPQVSYNNKFGKHDISAMLMYEQSESGGNGLNAFRNTVVIDNYEVLQGYSQNGIGNGSSINTLSRRQSFIGRFNYNYADKYFVESATRYESSTNFAPGYRWGLFPSISAGWRISEEPFFKDNIKFIENLKLRASYGRLGNDKASMNQWRSSYGQAEGAYLGGSSLLTVLSPTMEGLVYYSSTWEKTDSYNAGFDLNMLNGFKVGLDGFYRHTFDILDDFKSEFPQSAGVNAATPKLNKGIQNSWGGELEIGYSKKINKDWEVFAKANMAYATNKVIQKSQNPGVIGTWKDEIGRIRGGEVGYNCLGIARSQEDIDNYIAGLKANSSTGTITVLGLTESSLKPGMLMYQDVGSAPYKDANGNWHDGAPDGNITEDDQRIISKYDSSPFNYGFSLGFSWKNLKVDALFNGAFGNDVVFEKGFWTDASGGSRTGEFLSLTSNQLREWYGNYWTEANPSAKYPRLDTYSLRNQRSTFWMRDGHTLRLRSVNVSYSLPKKFTQVVGIEQARVFFSGTNLLTLINPYPYKDASVGFWSDYPMIQSFNFGLNLNF